MFPNLAEFAQPSLYSHGLSYSVSKSYPLQLLAAAQTAPIYRLSRGSATLPIRWPARSTFSITGNSE